MDTINRYAPPRAEVKDMPDFADTAAVPRLWNPGAAAAWSLLLSPAFGAAVHMRNWRVMGEHAKAKESLVWLVATVAILFVLGVATGLLPDSRGLDRLTQGGGTGLLAAWYFTSGHRQQKYVKERYGTGYMRKGWGKPLGIAVGAVVAYLVAAFAVGFVIGYLDA
jgi:hypothetical protein